MDILVIGTGHYVTGFKENKDFESDKDCGVILPSLFYLKNQGLVNDITLVSGNGKKQTELLSHIKKWSNQIFSREFKFSIYPEIGEIDYSSYLKLLDRFDFDAAFVCTPDETHFEILVSLAKKNIPTFVLKPCTLNLNELYQLQDLSKNMVFVDYHKIYDEANIKIFNSLQRKKIGNLHHVYSQQTQKKIMIDQYMNRLMKQPKTFINYYLGSHYIHLTSFLTGAKPVSVRTTGQYGIAKERSNNSVCDLTQTQIEWRLEDSSFSSYHIAGWCDPNQGPSMTYQSIELIGSNGRISSDQRYRGYSENIESLGISEPNPYFFSLDLDYSNAFDPTTNYGFKSIFTFLKKIKDISPFDKIPDLVDSENVTAILEAGELSFTNNSNIVYINRNKNRYFLGFKNDSSS